MVTKQKVSEEEIDRLKAWIEANNYTVYTVVRSVARSGMSREISVVIPLINEHTQVQQFVHPSYTVAGLLGRTYSEKNGHNAVVCHGCGMDMGFDLVQNLSYALYKDERKIRQEWI
jgi:hypothetical protein